MVVYKMNISITVKSFLFDRVLYADNKIIFPTAYLRILPYTEFRALNVSFANPPS